MLCRPAKSKKRNNSKGAAGNVGVFMGGLVVLLILLYADAPILGL
jgi:hypothetical protein